MAEIIGIIASAITVVNATAAALDTINKVKDVPKYIKDLNFELEDLTIVLQQIRDTFTCQKGDPTEKVLRSCSQMLKKLHDLITPIHQSTDTNIVQQYVKSLRVRVKQGEIESMIKRIQSYKLTLTLALISSIRRSDPLFTSAGNVKLTLL